MLVPLRLAGGTTVDRNYLKHPVSGCLSCRSVQFLLTRAPFRQRIWRELAYFENYAGIHVSNNIASN